MRLVSCTTPGDQHTRPSLHVSDLEPECAFGIANGSIIYYNTEFGLSIIKPTQTKPARLCDEFNAAKLVSTLAVSRDHSNRVIALTPNSLHLISLSGSDPLPIEHSNSEAFHHCAFADGSCPTLFVTTWPDGPYRGDILVYEFGCECPAELKPISEFWPLVTDYAGSYRPSFRRFCHRFDTTECLGQFRRVLKPSVQLGWALSVCVTPSRHLIGAANFMCSLFAVDTESGETVE